MIKLLAEIECPENEYEQGKEYALAMKTGYYKVSILDENKELATLKAQQQELMAERNRSVDRDQYNKALKMIAELEAKLAERAAVPDKYMPLMGTGLMIGFHVLDERQAQLNHGQSLQRLKERGGLGASEALAIAEKRKWKNTDIESAIKALSALALKAAPQSEGE